MPLTCKGWTNGGYFAPSMVGALDVAVNCQFPSAVGAWGAIEGADAELPGIRPGAPPQPQKRTATKSARMISKGVMETPLPPDLNRLFFMIPVSILESVCLYSLSGKQSHKVTIFFNSASSHSTS
jgi:hypothetical protein